MSFLTMNEYLLGAKKIMVRQRCGHLVRDDDAVSDVAYRMMLADHTWDGSSSRGTWRYNQAKYGIMKVLANKKREKSRNIKSLDYEMGVNGDGSQTLKDCIADPKFDTTTIDQYNELCYRANTILNGVGLQCFNMYYKENMTMDEIGTKLGYTRANVSLHIIRGTKRLKEWMLKYA